MADVIEIHRQLGLHPTTVVDQIDGGCAALAKAFQLVKMHGSTDPNWKALIIGANDVSSMINKERYLSVPKAWMSPAIFADGAGAMVLGPGNGGHRLSEVYCAVDGNHPLVTYQGGGSAKPTSSETLEDHVYVMDARDVATQFVPAMSRVLKNLLTRSCLPLDTIGCWFLHQANFRLIEKFAGLQRISMGKIPHNVDRIGNTVSASTLLLLNEETGNGELTEAPFAFVYVGAGMMEGGALFLPQE